MKPDMTKCNGRNTLNIGQLNYWERRAKKAGLITEVRPSRSGRPGEYDLYWSPVGHGGPFTNVFACTKCYPREAK
jgi:hypothetical protein